MWMEESGADSDEAQGNDSQSEENRQGARIAATAATGIPIGCEAKVARWGLSLVSTSRVVKEWGAQMVL